MALPVFQRTITDEKGNVLAGASVRIRKETAGAPLVALYRDRDGTQGESNPATADGDGFVRVYVADPGAYKITATSGSKSITWRHVPIGTAQEHNFDDIGALVQNVDAGWALTFESETAAPPSAGAIRFNHADLSQATEAYVHRDNLGGSEILDLLTELYSASRSRKDRFTLHDPANNTQASFQVDNAVQSGSPVDSVTLTISAHEGETSFTDGEPVNMQPEKSGADGDFSGPGSATDGHAVVFDGPTGAQGKSAEGRPMVIVADTAARDALTAADGMVVFVLSESQFYEYTGSPLAWTLTAAASVSNIGGVELSTLAEIYQAASGDKAFLARHLKEAAAPVTLAEAGSPELDFDWAGGINRELTLTADRILGNPSNGQPGTWRHILVKGEPESPNVAKTLSFGSQYQTENADTLDDITDEKHYLVSIWCKSASKFIVYTSDGSDP